MSTYDPHALVTVPLDSPGPPFTFPENLRGCVTSVLRGEYAFPLVPDRGPVNHVLDIGANVGSFARWALARWPNAKLTSVEPHPTCFELLKGNVQGLAVDCVRAAVIGGIGPCSPITLYVGSDWGMNTLDPRIGNQSGESLEVPAMRVAGLPAADVIKVDAEGIEYDVIEQYPYKDRVQIAFVEIHRECDRRACEELLLYHWGLRLFRSNQPLVCVMQQVWIRSKAVFDPQRHEYTMPGAP